MVTGTLGSGETVQISLDNGSTWNTATLVSGSTYSYDNTANTLVAGSYNVRARVVDTAGNTGTVSAPTVVTIDTSGPAMTAVALTAITTDTAAGLVLGTASTTDTAVNTDLVTRDSLLTVSGTYVGNVLAGEVMQVSTDGGANWTNVTTLNNTLKTWSYTDPVAKTAATTYQLRAIDTAGNVATGTVSTVVTVDTTAPSITSLVAPILTSAFDTGALGDNITTTTTAITFSSATSGLGEVGSTLVLVNDINNDGIYSQGIDSILGVTTVAAGGTWSLSTAGQAVGVYHLALMAVDAAGNRSVLTESTSISVVSSDVPDATTTYAGSNALTAVYLSSDGLWKSIGTQTNGHSFGNEHQLISVQVSLTAFALALDNNNQVFGTANALTMADFQRVGYSGMFSMGDNLSSGGILSALATSNGNVFTKMTLSGNDRAYGAVVAYDKTGDGYLDFALGDLENNSLNFVTNTGGALTWMNGTATTGAGRPTAIGTFNNYAEASAVDLDNNGTVDIAEHTDALGNHTLTFFKNNQLTTNTFALEHVANIFQTPGWTAPVAMTWADFNNDGFMDLYLNKGMNVAQNNDSSASRIYWNDHTGGFGAAEGTTGGMATYFTDNLNGSGSLAVDWNHDGRMDVIETPARGESGSIMLYANQGGGVFASGVSLSTLVRSDFLGVTPLDLNWDGATDLLISNPVPIYTSFDVNAVRIVSNNNAVANGTSLHLSIFDAQGINAFYSNTVQLYNSAGTLVSSQIINPQMGLTSNDTSALVYFYGLNAAETYTAVLLKSVNGVSNDVSGLGVVGGKTIEQVNATWTGLTTDLATHHYVLSAEAGNNSASGSFIGTGYNDTFFATAGTDTFTGGAGWLTHYGTPAWSINGGEDVVDFTLAGSTAVTVNLNTITAQSTGFNTVTLTGIEGITGGAGNDNLTANSTAGVNSLLDGRGGNDTYTISGGGHTLLTFTNINNSHATGGNGSDIAIGFGMGNVNSVVAADVIDLSALLTGYTGTAYVYTDITTSKPVLDKASEGLMNYLSITNNGTNTSISVDRDGAGSTFAPTLVLTLNNVATDMETLLVNHQLIV
ncbi:hypothetical protein EMIT0P265_230001 [Pseudomonas zeae]